VEALDGTDNIENTDADDGVKFSSRTRMELQFHPGPARKLSTNLYDIHQCRVYSE